MSVTAPRQAIGVREALWALLGHAITPLRRIEPVSTFARLSVIGFAAYGIHWLSGFNKYALMAVAFLWFWRRGRTFDFGTIYGSARWSGRRELVVDKMLGHRNGVLLGRYREVEYTRFETLKRLFTLPLSDSDHAIRHLITTLTNGRIHLNRSDEGQLICAPPGKYINILTVAPAGAGKGIGVVIPNLLNYKNSVIVLDIKGENYTKTAHVRREWGQTVVALNPFLLKNTDTGEEIGTATLNPFAMLDTESPELIDDLRGIAESLVIRGAKEDNPYWNDQAVNLIHAILAFVMTTPDPEIHHFECIKGILSDRDEIETCLLHMARLKGESPRGNILASKATSLLGIPPKEFGSIFSAANQHLEFLNSERVIPNVASTSFDVRSIATTPTSVYLILPAQYLHSHKNLMRLWINTLMLVVKQAGVGEKNEILFVLDEISQLGEFRPVEEAITLLRAMGMRLWFIVQSINQIETSYPGPRAKTLLGNFKIQQYFGISDPETAAHISKMIGKRTQIAPSFTAGWTSGSSHGQSSSSSTGRSGGTSHGAIERDHIKPEEVLRENEIDSVFIFRQGRFPIQARRLTYYEDSEFQEPTPQGTKSRASIASYLVSLAALWGLYAFMDTTSFQWPFTQAGPHSEATQTPLTALPVTEALLQRDGIPTTTAIAEPPATIRLRCPSCLNEGEIPAAYAKETVACERCGVLLRAKRR